MRLHNNMQQILSQATTRQKQLKQRLLANSPAVNLQKQRFKLQDLDNRLMSNSPAAKIALTRQQLASHSHTLEQAIKNKLAKVEEKLHSMGSRLDSVSPLATLSRGYSITRNDHDDIIRHAKTLQNGDLIHTEFSDGKVISKVERVKS